MEKTLRQRLAELEAEGAKFILAYDYTTKGADKMVDNLRQRKDTTLLESVLVDVIKVGDGVERKRGKSKYVIVALHSDHVEKIKIRWKMEFGRVEYRPAFGIVGWVKTTLRDMGMVPVETKDAGAYVLFPEDVVSTFLALS